MAIHFISGKPGGGKTLYSLKLILEELIHGSRLVVTNVSLKLPELNEFIQTRHPRAAVDLFSRVRILSEEECSEFWKFRHREGTEDLGAFIVLDELHLFFNARKWMDTGEDCLHYLSQHRKLGDDVLCVTQHVENVDKQFRSVAQDFTVVKNGYTAKIGWFRGLPCFTRKTYSAMPNGGDKQQPFETASFTLDAKGLASCYDTAAGIGVHGRHADKGKKPKGLHPLWFAVGVAAICAFVFFGLKLGIGSQIKKVESHIPAPSPPVKAAEPQKLVAEVESKDSQATRAAQPRASEQDGVKVRGYAVHGRKINVALTDGRTFNETDEELEKVGRGYVQISGVKYRLIEPGPGNTTLPPPPAPLDLKPEDAAPLPLPPPAPESSWETASDGVSRLKQVETVADLFAPNRAR
jgi:hypothetical protein